MDGFPKTEMHHQRHVSFAYFKDMPEAYCIRSPHYHLVFAQALVAVGPNASTNTPESLPTVFPMAEDAPLALLYLFLQSTLQSAQAS